MSELPPELSTANAGRHRAPDPPGSPPSRAPGRPTRWPTFAALAVAIIGVAVGFVGWFRPTPHTIPPPVHTDQQVADAKAKVCAAFAKVERAVNVAKAAPHGDDANGTLAAATTMRQVFDAGSRYLSTMLAEEQATPVDLTTAMRSEARSLQEGVIDYLDGLTNADPEMQPVVNANTEAANTIHQLCK